MKKVVIIGANNFQMPLIIKAKKLGYETHVFAWKEGAVGAKYADCFLSNKHYRKRTNSRKM